MYSVAAIQWTYTRVERFVRKTNYSQLIEE